MIVKAQKEDIKAIAKLRVLEQKESWDIEYPENDEYVYTVTTEFFEKHLNKDVFSYIKRVDKDIVAICCLQIINYLPYCTTNGKEGYIFDVFTLKEYRHKGIQTRLLTKLINFAKDKEVFRINLKSENLEAIAIYKRLGFCFSDNAMQMYISENISLAGKKRRNIKCHKRGKVLLIK